MTDICAHRGSARAGTLSLGRWVWHVTSVGER